MSGDRKKITFLDLVFPLCFIYVSGLVFWAYFIKTQDYSNPILDVVVIFITSTFFCYGVIAFIKDIKRLGIVKLIKDFIKIR
jgi:hypothetical protein